MTTANKQRIWIVSELYYPETTSTGHVMTTIAEGLAATKDVHVVCTQPTYSQRGKEAPRQEVRHRVHIHRARSSTLDNKRLTGRLANLVTSSLGMAWLLARRLRSNDVVFVVTNPPTLPYLVTVVTRLRLARCTLLVHDLFPEVLNVLGRVSPSRRVITKPLYALGKWLVRQMNEIVVLGPDQAELVEAKLRPSSDTLVHTIPLAFDGDLAAPIQRSLSKYAQSLPPDIREKCLFQFAGNIGPLQGVDFLKKAIAMQRVDDAHFCFVGAGRSSVGLKADIAAGRLPNVTMSPEVPREDTADVHGGCDVVIISLVEGMFGISVPSRIGNALAAGRPILAITDRGSTLDRLIAQHNVGWSVRPGDSSGFWAAVELATTNADERRCAGMAARSLAERHYNPEQMIAAYQALPSISSPGTIR